MSENQAKAKKSLNFNPFVMLFIVILIVYIASFFVTPGAFDREEVNGRMQVVPGSYQTIDSEPLSPFDIFRSIPNGLIGSANIVFLVLIVGGAVEIFNSTGAIPAGVNKLVGIAGKQGSTFVLVIFFAIFAVLGGFLGWVEAAIPFVPLVIPVILALGYDSMTAVGLVILGCMGGFAVGPTNMYTIGIAHQIAELPMFSGFGLRFVVYLVFCLTCLVYLLMYANKVKKDPSKSLTTGIDISDLKFDYTQGDNQMTGSHGISLLVLAATFGVTVFGMMRLGWTINEMTAAFLIAGIIAGFIGKMGPSKIVNTIIAGARGSLTGAMVVGVARGVQWMLDETGLMDPIIFNISRYLENLPPVGSAIGIFVVVTILNGFVASGSGKAVALMPIIIPLADLVGVSRQTATLAYQFGDGISNMAWFTYGTLLIFLAYGKVPLSKWYKFLWPLLIVLLVLAVVFLFIAVGINYQ